MDYSLLCVNPTTACGATGWWAMVDLATGRATGGEAAVQQGFWEFFE